MIVVAHPYRRHRPRSRRRRIGILDLVTKSSRNSLYGRLMNANLASIMPQVLARLVRGGGPRGALRLLHRRARTCSTELPADLDLLFIGAFTQAAQLAYAMSNLFRQRGAITVLGGPHARCYPEDAAAVLRLRARLHRPAGARGGARGVRAAPARWAGDLAAARQPARAAQRSRRGGSSSRRRWPRRR